MQKERSTFGFIVDSNKAIYSLDIKDNHRVW